MRILLVEDERRLSGYIAKGLQNAATRWMPFMTGRRPYMSIG